MAVCKLGNNLRKKMQGVSSEGTEITWQNLEAGFDAIRAGQSVNYEGVTGPVTLDEFGNLSEGFIELWTVGDEGPSPTVAFNSKSILSRKRFVFVDGKPLLASIPGSSTLHQIEICFVC